MRRTTLKDIAKALNVSISTVSKALSDSYEISPATKEKINNYAKKQHFSPNKLAQGLKIGRTNTIGVIIPNVSNVFAAQIMDGIQIASERASFDIIIMQSREDEKIEKNCIDVLKMRGIDGLMISPVSYSSNLLELTQLQQSKIPVIIFDRIKHSLNTFKVGVDNYEGAYSATKHLIEQGKKKILHITGKNLGVAEERLNGFKACLADYNIPFSENMYMECNLNNIQDLDRHIKETILHPAIQKRDIDAIFGATDVITTRTLGLLAELEVEVPREIAVIGFSNTQIGFSLNPALSAVVQPASKIGEIATEKLIKTIRSKHPVDEFDTITLKTDLVIRKSSL